MTDAGQDLQALRERAEQGDAQSQFKLGMVYARGKGVPEDYEEAIKWLRKAAAQRHDEDDFLGKNASESALSALRSMCVPPTGYPGHDEAMEDLRRLKGGTSSASGKSSCLALLVLPVLLIVLSMILLM